MGHVRLLFSGLNETEGEEVKRVMRGRLMSGRIMWAMRGANALQKARSRSVNDKLVKRST